MTPRESRRSTDGVCPCCNRPLDGDRRYRPRAEVAAALIGEYLEEHGHLPSYKWLEQAAGLPITTAGNYIRAHRKAVEALQTHRR